MSPLLLRLRKRLLVLLTQRLVCVVEVVVNFATEVATAQHAVTALIQICARTVSKRLGAIYRKFAIRESCIMFKHKGMRPQDVALLLRLTLPAAELLSGKELAHALHLSAAEVSDALQRCRYSRLLQGSPRLRQVQPRALLEFLLYGLPYVFPVQPGAQARGLATGPSAPPLVATFGPEPAYVWPGATGEVWGAAVEPLYAGAPAAAHDDAHLYELLALVDALRLGRPRERRVASELLAKALGIAITPSAYAS